MIRPSLRCAGCALCCALALLVLSVSSVHPEETVRCAEELSSAAVRSPVFTCRLPVILDEQNTAVSAYRTEDGTVYLALRDGVNLLFPGAAVSWDTASGSASVRSARTDMTVFWHAPYLLANGRALGLPGFDPPKTQLADGVTYVPLQLLARAAGASVLLTGTPPQIRLTRGNAPLSPGDSFYNQEDLSCLSRIIEAEAGGESLRGKLAVGAVILARRASPLFPDTVRDVIFDRRHGIQFSPAADGTLHSTPSEESILAAKLVLDGALLSEEALFFFNPRLTDSRWIAENRPFLFSVGQHDFYG